MFTFSALGDILSVFFYGFLVRSSFNKNKFNYIVYLKMCIPLVHFVIFSSSLSSLLA